MKYHMKISGVALLIIAIGIYVAPCLGVLAFITVGMCVRKRKNLHQDENNARWWGRREGL